MIQYSVRQGSELELWLDGGEMVQTVEGQMLARPDDSFAIVVSRFNDLVTGRLLEGAISTLRRHGASEAKITAVWVPGSFELSLVAERLATSGKYVAVIALGAVIQGSTLITSTSTTRLLKV